MNFFKKINTESLFENGFVLASVILIALILLFCVILLSAFVLYLAWTCITLVFPKLPHFSFLDALYIALALYCFRFLLALWR